MLATGYFCLVLLSSCNAINTTKDIRFSNSSEGEQTAKKRYNYGLEIDKSNLTRVENYALGENPKYKVLASIRTGDSYNLGQFTHRCSGILVSAAVVISVAHCLHDQYGNFILKPATYRIIIGSTFLLDNNDFLMVSRVALHRNYRLQNKLHDLSLFKLEKDQTYLTPDLYFLRAENLPNLTDCVFYAWVTDISNESLQVFTALHTKINDRRNCYLEMTNSQTYMSPYQLCFTLPKYVKNLCLYNAGAPILCHDILVGLFSFSTMAQQDETTGKIGLFVDVGQYIDYIEEFATAGKSSWMSIAIEKTIFCILIYFCLNLRLCL